MKNKGRLLPNWVPNIILFSVFFFLIVYFSCKSIALGYKMSKLAGTCQDLKSWNQYYRTEVLKEFSEEKIRLKVEKMNLSLSVPEDWRIKEIEDTRILTGKNNGKVEASTK